MVKIVKNASGGYVFSVITPSGSSLLKGIPCTSKAQAQALMEEALMNPVFERQTNHQGKFVIALKTAAGKKVGWSNPYSSEAGMENGLKNIQKSLMSN